jgi:hypothetical protein
MTSSQAVRLASRLFALYLLFCMLTELIGLPQRSITVHHEWTQWSLAGNGMSGRTLESLRYFYTLAIGQFMGDVLRVVIYSLLAVWFYQCGPRIQRFFAIEDTVDSEDTNTISD